MGKEEVEPEEDPEKEEVAEPAWLVHSAWANVLEELSGMIGGVMQTGSSAAALWVERRAAGTGMVSWDWNFLSAAAIWSNS